MAFRIIRGALVGAVLGILIGVALSGSMYMFNYMRQGAKEKDAQGLIASEEYVATLNVDGSTRSYNYKELAHTLQEQGITGLAKQVAHEGGASIIGASAIGASEEEQQDVLGEQLIRFHVRANSNTDVDIALKYKVRDGVLQSLEQGLIACTTREEALQYLTDNLEMIEERSEKILSEEGYNYAVKVYVTNDYFPMRQYGEMVLPAGYYEALRIDIGLANGENFWCLLYPTMCFPMEAGGIITKEGQQEIEEALTPEQYDKLFVKKEVPKEDIEIRFKLWELIFE